MISIANTPSMLSYLTTQTTNADSDTATTAATLNAGTKARMAATAQAALQAASAAPKASVAGHALDKQQATLAGDLRNSMGKAGIALTGTVEFSVSSDGTVAVKGSDADKAATTAFLKADTSRPSFATRIATQAKDTLKLSATIQQNAAISQAARYAGQSSGVMSLYTSLMQQSSTTTAVFSLSAASSSLTYPGSLTTKA